MSKADTKEQVQGEMAVVLALRAGRTIVGKEFKAGDRVVSNGTGILPTPEGLNGTVIARFPGEQWHDDMSGWNGQLEWCYSVRWDDRDWNNAGNRPVGIINDQLDAPKAR